MMGSFSYLTINDYPIFENKNGYFKEVVDLLFLPGDFIEEKRPYTTRNKLFWGDAYKNSKGNFIFRGFKQSVKICKQRLEIYGNSIQRVKREFNEAKQFAEKEYYYTFPITKVTFEKYMEELNYILTNKLKKYDELFTNLRDSLITLDLGIYGLSTAAHLYSIFNLLPDDTIIEYDLTDIIPKGSAGKVEAQAINVEKIIVLTEGKTDVEFISKTLNLLYPHLFPYYHFINFDEYKVESNASALVKLVVSFAAANIKHPMIALFDNDTTGIMEMKALIAKSLPEKFKVLKLPDIKLAKNYPTLGPSGIKKMNVNGYACGIEMYFGEDVLKIGNVLTPIRWKGFNDKEKKYQGEISDKATIQDKYRQKLISNSTSHFEDMHILLSTIFRALSQQFA